MPAKLHGAVSLETLAARLTATLARKPKKQRTRMLLATLPKRDAIIVDTSEYSRDALRYQEWVDRGKPPSPSIPPKVKSRLRPGARHSRWKSHNPLASRILAIQGGVCVICGEAVITTCDPCDPLYATIEHVVPKARGGLDHDNRLVTHRKCNGEKAARLPTGCELIWLAAVNGQLAQGIVTEGQDAERLGERSE